jgi:dTDP-4-amino-4,6-dideoxygalactose transaminase
MAEHRQPRSAQALITLQPEEHWPYHADDEIEAARAVLRSGRTNQWTGTCVTTFEQRFCERFGMPHAVAVFNGTVALELALRALGIGPGDEVIVSSRSFMASASCVSCVGATPVFADVDPHSQNMTPATIAPLITARTRAIIPVHLAGWPCDMPEIMALARKHDLVVIEDCAQSHGATIDGAPTGSFGDAAAFSFCQDKIITTGGEGGMVLIRDPAAYRRAWSYKDHGKDFELMRSRAVGTGFRYVHTSIGTNWRMLEMQAAIGLVQLDKLDGWLDARAHNARIWQQALSHCRSLRLPEPGNRYRHAWYKYYVFVDTTKLKPNATRDDIVTALVGAGLKAFTGSCPEIYREQAYAAQQVATRPVAEALGRSSLMFEVHPTLDPKRLAARADLAAKIIATFEA